MSELLLLKSAIYKAFPGITEPEVVNLIREGVVKEYPVEQDLCIEGNEEDVFYILLDGKVEVTKKINSSDKRLLNELYPGDFFGEMGLIARRKRSGTVTATSDSILLYLTREKFEKLFKSSAQLRLNLDVAVKSRQMARTLRFKWVRKDEVIYFLARKHPILLYQHLHQRHFQVKIV